MIKTYIILVFLSLTILLKAQNDTLITKDNTILVGEIKEMTKPVATAPILAVVEPVEKNNVEQESAISNNSKPMSTKEYVAKSRYSRRRLAF